MVAEALSAAEKLKHEGIDLKVVNMHTIKPIDVQMIVNSAKETGAIVTAEEHQMAGGLGSAVAEVLGQHYPCPMEMVGVKDSFGESGTPAQLLAHYGLKDVNIVEAVKKVITSKKGINMTKTKLHEIAELGQSLWIDNISRSMITSGKLKSLIDQGLRGQTSNPTIFKQAISYKH